MRNRTKKTAKVVKAQINLMINYYMTEINFYMKKKIKI